MRRLVIISVRLSLILFVVQVSVLAGAKLISQNADGYDPIALYQAIMPGASIGALANYPCSWNEETTSQYPTGNCSIYSEEFRASSVNIQGRNHTIERLVFQIANLHVGDLPMYWGPPVVEQFGRFSYAQWSVGDYQVTVLVPISRDQFSYWSPIDYLTIETNPQ